MKSQMIIRSIAVLLLASLNLAMSFGPAAVPAGIVPMAPVAANIPSLVDFAATLNTDGAKQVVGVYVPYVLALKVAQQPANDPAYVGTISGYVTQFSLATLYGTTGLLAHNYLAGALFVTLSAGQEVDLIYGDRSIQRYSISILRHFQALRPTDFTSDFVDLDSQNHTQISNADLFHQIYAQGNRVVFQTCITVNGDTSWGRLFVIATPIPLSSGSGSR